MILLKVILTMDLQDKAAAEAKLQVLKNKIQGTGIKLSASVGEMLQDPQVQ